MIHNTLPIEVPRPNIFRAKYPQISRKRENSSWIRESVDQIASYIHKKLGMYILTAQKNPHKFTVQEREKGCQNLSQLGGKLISFETSDRVLLKGMHFIGKGCSENSPTIILFNGNGLRYEEYGSQTFSGGIRIFRINSWMRMGLNVFIFNYRGIDSAPGSATRDGLILDGDAAFQYVQKRLKVPKDKIIFHGHSLGAGIASEVAAMHPIVNFCSDRSFSSLSQQIKMMLGGGMFGMVASCLARHIGWEFNVTENLKKIKGHKWVIYHPNDKRIPVRARVIDAISAIEDKISVIAMTAQQFQTKKGLRPEDLSQIKKPTAGQISYAACSTHMRKLHGSEEKDAYKEQVNIALGNLTS